MAIIDKIQLSGTVYTIGNETTTAVTSASTDNEIPTAKAVYDAIPQGGGGKAIEAGRGISITTGETADTVSFNLPISAITGTDIMYGGDNNSISITNGISNYNNFFGSENTISVSGLTKTSAMYNIVLGNKNSVNFKGAEESWQYSLIIGYNNSVSYSTYMGGASAYNIICGNSNTIDKNISNCFVIGSYNKPKKKFNTNIGQSLNTTNDYEFALAKDNVSSSATTSFGNSGNTLFSVGNGSSESARHNAFEIRQNGDIYIADTNDTSTTNYYEKPMIKLQDALGGGGGSTYTAGDGIDITNDVISVTGKVDTSAFTAHTADTVIHVTSAEKAAWNDKQDALVSGTNIKTINNQSILGEGNITIEGGSGKAVSGGRGISITTGETADTVSFNLPISAGTKTNALIYNSTMNVASGDYSNAEGYNTTTIGSYSHAEGFIANAKGVASHAEGLSTKSKGFGSHAEGRETEASGDYSHSEGYLTRTTNESEHSSGRYNNSVSASTTFGDSGNTLFSVGNGTADNARHNAFEIRQNGDIYISKDGQDVKLQDQLGGGGSSYTAGDGIDITNDVISVTGKVDTSAITTSVTSASTDAQVPSAKAVYDMVGNINTILETI